MSEDFDQHRDIRDRARALGLEPVGVVRVDGDDGLWPAEQRLRDFVAQGRHGDMDWMETHLERRVHPRALWAEAKAAIVVGLNYGPDSDPMAGLSQPERGVISVYAQGKDYHDVFKKRLKRLASWFATTSGQEVKVFVDTAPLMEKPLAQAAGVGWQGKHTNLVSREFGSWLFLGVILTSADLAGDGGEGDHCGSCTQCLDVCPTRAFPAPYQLDARRCLAYLSIEHKGPIPVEFREPMGNRVFGCDDCLAVCPWNKFAQRTAEAALSPREGMDLPELVVLSRLDDAAFRARFAGTPVKRTGRDRFVRNVVIAMGNSGAAVLMPEIMRLLGDDSALVRGAAVWAASRLMRGEDFARLAGLRAGSEADDDVRAEWDGALG